MVHGYPGLRSEVLTYTEDRVRAAKTGTSDPLVVRLFGTDLTELATKADEVRALIADVPGVVSPTVEKLTQEPTIEVQVNLPPRRSTASPPATSGARRPPTTRAYRSAACTRIRRSSTSWSGARRRRATRRQPSAIC